MRKSIAPLAARDNKQMNAHDLEFLESKYRQLLDLRRENDAARLASLPEGHRAKMRALATLAPGALRELDQRSTASMEARLDELRAVRTRAVEPAPWMPLVARFHGEMRHELEIRQGRATREPTPSSDVSPESRRVGAGKRSETMVGEVTRRLAHEAGVDLADLLDVLFGHGT